MGGDRREWEGMGGKGLLVIVAFEQRGGLVGECGRLGFAFGSFGGRWRGRTWSLPFWRLL